jgi:hypothetical protein
VSLQGKSNLVIKLWAWNQVGLEINERIVLYRKSQDSTFPAQSFGSRIRKNCYLVGNMFKIFASAVFKINWTKKMFPQPFSADIPCSLFLLNEQAIN